MYSSHDKLLLHRRKYEREAPAATARRIKYRQSKKYKEYTKKRAESLKGADKFKARYYAANAIRDGRLVRLDHCERCDAKEWGTKRKMIEANHYKGYDRENWLVVEWLCTYCHKRADGFLRAKDDR